MQSLSQHLKTLELHKFQFLRVEDGNAVLQVFSVNFKLFDQLRNIDPKSSPEVTKQK